VGDRQHFFCVWLPVRCFAPPNVRRHWGRKSLQRIVVMLSLFTSQGESRPWSVQVLARRGRRYALATRGLSERTSREGWGWWGSSQWNRYNSKEIESCLLLLRTYLFFASVCIAWDKGTPRMLRWKYPNCAKSKSESRSSDHIGKRLAAIHPNARLKYRIKSLIESEVAFV